MDIQNLTDSFSIPGVLAFSQSDAGLVRARINTPACSAEIYLQGAHVTGWQPAGHGPVLFLSERSSFAPGKVIRGGVPLIFPWFGARTGARTDGPTHGFARTELWELVFAALSGDELHLTLTLSPNELSRSLGFDHFRVAYKLVFGETLTMRLTIVNEANVPLHFEEGFHTYFAVGDATKVGISGLAGTEYLDKTDGFRRKLQTDPVIKLTGETDRPYLNTSSAVKLEDPTLRRRITVAKEESETTVIWNPWIDLTAKLADMAGDGWRHMTCIETANAAENAITLAPQSAHTMEARIGVEAF